MTRRLLCSLFLGGVMTLGFSLSADETSAQDLTPPIVGAAPSPSAPAAVTPTTRLSDSIPDHTPYAFGYEPLEREAKEEVAPLTSLITWWELISARASERSATWTEEEREAWRSLVALPFPKNQADLEAMGFDRMPHFWIYGLGLTPMLALEVPSMERLSEWARVHLSGAKLGFVELKHSSGRYWRRPLKRWTILVRSRGSRIYLALIPQSAEPVLLSYFLRDKQTQSLTATLQDALKRLPPQARGSGIIQLKPLVDLFFGSDIPLLKYSGGALGLPSPLFASCESDLRSIGDTFTSLTLGLSQASSSKQTTQETYDLYTHLEIADPLRSQLLGLRGSADPLWLPEREGALSVGLRLDVQSFMRLLSERGETWRETPWECRPLRSLNLLNQWVSRDDYQALLGMIGGAMGMSFQVELEDPQAVKKRGGSPGVSSIFTGWVELIHTNAPLFLSFSYNALTQKALSPTYAQPNHTLHEISSLFPHLPAPLLSLHPRRVLMSIGAGGAEAHRVMNQQLRFSSSDQSKLSKASQPAKILSSTQPPLLWLDLPPKLGEWFSNRLDSYQAKAGSGKTHSKNAKTQTSEGSKSRLERLQIHLNDSGLLIQSTLSTKSL